MTGGSRSRPIRRASLAATGVLLGAWFAASAAINRGIILPDPLQTLSALGRLAGDSGFYRALLSTVLRALLGFVIAYAGGGALGLLAARFPLAKGVLAPVVVVIRSTPVVAIILLAMIWIPAGGVAILVSVLMTLPIVYESLRRGLAELDPDLLEMARSFSVSRKGIIAHIVIPSLRPFFLSAGASALGITWKVIVAAEVLAQPQHGIGTSMQVSRMNLMTAEVFALTLVAILLSGISEGALNALARGSRKGRDRSGSDGRGSDGAAARLRRSRSGKVSGPPHAATPGPAPSQGAGGRGRGDAGMPPATVAADTPPSGVALAGRGMSKSFGPLLLMRDFDFSSTPGETTVLLGPSGCGKTTLLRCLAGLLPIDGGSVEEGGEARVGFVFQSPRLLPWRNARDNVLFVPRRAGGGAESAGKEAIEILETLGIGAQANLIPAELSGGMTQRVALARALYYGAEILLLDEPLQGLDFARRWDLIRLFRRVIKNGGATVVMVTHDVREALLMGDRIVIVDGPPLGILRDYTNPVRPEKRSPWAEEISIEEARVLSLLLERGTAAR